MSLHDQKLEVVLSKMKSHGEEAIKIPINPKDLDQKYKNYLQHKNKLKKNLMELKRINLETTLEEKHISEETRKKLELEREFLEVLPFYVKLRHEVLKKIIEQTNSRSDFLIEKYYLDYNFFKREKKRPNLN